MVVKVMTLRITLCLTIQFIQVVILYFHLAYPLYAFCTEFRSGLNLLIKRFSFSFLAIILSEFIYKRKHKIVGIFCPKKWQYVHLQGLFGVFVSDVLVMQCGSIS